MIFCDNRVQQLFYHSITEFVFSINILGKRSDLPFSRKSDRKKEKSVVSFTHEQNSICSQKQLNDIAHEHTIICRQLFAGHVVGSWPMKRKKHLHRMINNNYSPMEVARAIFTEPRSCKENIHQQPLSLRWIIVLVYSYSHPRRPRSSQSGRENRRDESFQNFRRAYSLDPTDCPWVSEDELFQERLSEKKCTRQSRKVIWDMINTLFLTL